jgi:C4-dicarboxylate-specific signal transduction histidine kinase
MLSLVTRKFGAMETHRLRAIVIVAFGLVSAGLILLTLITQFRAYEQLRTGLERSLELSRLAARLERHAALGDFVGRFSPNVMEEDWLRKYRRMAFETDFALGEIAVQFPELKVDVEIHAARRGVAELRSLIEESSRLWRLDQRDQARILFESSQRGRLRSEFHVSLKAVARAARDRTRDIVYEANESFYGTWQTFSILVMSLCVFWYFLLRVLKSHNDSLENMNNELDRRVQEKARELEDSHAQMIHSSKMAALGEMAGGIAHEINNPLAVIQLRASQLRELGSDRAAWTGEATIKALTTIEMMCQRIAKIMNSMRAVSRDSTADNPVQVPVSKVFEEVTILCAERMKRHRIQLHFDPITEGMEVFANETQLVQVLLNLCNNSIDVLKDASGLRWIRLGAAARPGQSLLWVSDSGPGVDQEVKEKMFMPFFTTKKVGHGTGLGLAISRGIIESHGGSLYLDENLRETTFVIRLPAKPRAVGGLAA